MMISRPRLHACVAAAFASFDFAAVLSLAVVVDVVVVDEVPVVFAVVVVLKLLLLFLSLAASRTFFL